jgi:hypothetical protein
VLSGNVTCTLNLPRWSSTGVWTLNYVYCSDNRGSAVYDYFPSDLNGPGTSFTQVGLGDMNGPNITAFDYTPSTIDTSAAAASVSVAVTAADDLSGVSSCLVQFIGPPPLSISVSNWLYPPATSQGPLNVTGTLSFPRFSPNGVYTLNQIRCNDVTGKSTTLNSASFFFALGTPSFFIQQAGPGDTTPPVVTALSGTPSNIDTTASSQVVDFSITISDDLSGVSNCYIGMLSPSGSGNVVCYSSSFAAQQLMTGTLSCSLTVPRFSANGNWTWSYMYCSDVAGRQQYFSPSTLAQLARTTTAFTQSGLADNLVPVVRAFSFSPLVIDTASSSATVRFVFAVSDDVSGPQSCSASIRFPDQQTSTYSFSTFTGLNSTFGDMSGTITLSIGSPRGFYNITQVWCTDFTGKSLTFSGAQLPALSSTLAFEQISAGDGAPPVISWVRFSPLAVNTEAAPATITASINVSDDFSGVQGCYASITSPTSRTSRACSTNTFTRGQTANFVATCQFSLPIFAEQGNWTLNTAYCWDYFNRYTYVYSNDQSMNPQSQIRVQQVGIGDSQPPNVTAVSVSPTSVDTSTGQRLMTVTLTASDDLSGISYCILYFMNPLGSNQMGCSTNSFSARQFMSGPISCSFNLARFSPPGSYTWSYAYCYDVANLDRYLSPQQLATMAGSPIAFTQTGPGDTALPTLWSFSFSPTVVSTGTSSAIINFHLFVTDDVAGPQSCQVTIRFPDQAQNSYSFSTFNGVNATVGNITGSMTLNTGSPMGLYNITQIRCWDVSGKSQRYSSTALAALSPTLSFQQTSAGDGSAPIIWWMRYSPPTVNTEAGSATITATFNVSDDFSGVQGCYTSIASPTFSTSTGCQTPSSPSGQLLSGVLSCTLTLQTLSEQGNWTLNNGYCWDNFNRYTYLSYNTLVNNPLAQPRVLQMGAGDSQPPNMTALRMSPTAVDTSTGDQPMTVTLTVSDDSSGVQYCYIYFLSPLGSNSVSCWTPSYSMRQMMSGPISCSFNLARFSPPGNYTWSYAYCYDVANRGRYFPPTDLAALGGSPIAFTQTGPGDTALPTLWSFSFSPTVVSTGTSSAIINFHLFVTDDVAGPQSCQVTILFPDQAQNSYSFSTFNGVNATVGNITGSMTLNAGSPMGLYNITQIRCWDVSGKSQWYSSTALAALSPTLSFQQTSAGDGAPPVIVWVRFSPATVNTTSASVTINATLGVSDDFSGIQSCYVRIRSPSFTNSFACSTPSFPRGEFLNGTLWCTFSMGMLSEQGNWTLDMTYCYDYNNRWTYRYLNDLRDAPFSQPFVMQAGVGDARPPNVTALAITPAVTNTSLQSVTLNVSISFFDDAAGLAYCYLYIRSPTSQTSVSCSTNSFNIGAFVRGVVFCPVNVPRFAEQGNWTWDYMYCYDNSNKQLYMGSSMMAQTAGSAIAFRQAAPGDSLPPTILSLALSPTSVSTATGSATITFTFLVVDDASGPQTCWVWLLYPDSGTYSFAFSSFTSTANATMGTVSGSITLGTDAPMGFYNVTMIQCSDRTGKSRTLSGNELAAVVPVRAFAQTSAGDSAAPFIWSVRISPARVNTSMRSASVNLTLNVTDDFSGVQSCYGAINSPSNSYSMACSTPSLSRGQFRNGTLTCAMTIPAFAEQGNWTFNYACCYDFANRYRWLYFSEVRDSSSSQLTVQQIAPGDNSPPNITRIVVSPRVVDTSATAQNINVSFDITDDSSGLSYCYFYVRSISGVSVGCNTNSFSPGAVLSGTVTCVINLPSSSAPGNWTWDYGYCYDNANRQAYFSTSSLAALAGSSTAFVQSGLGDTAPPVLFSLRYSPAVVNTSFSSALVTATFAVSDDFSGVAGCWQQMYSPTFATSMGCSTNGVRGVFNGTLSCSMTMSVLAEQGNWTFNNGYCWDYQSKYAYFYANDLASSSSSMLRVLQAGAGDNFPPNITAIRPDPRSITTSLGSRAVNFNLTINDDMSGLSYCYMGIRTPSGSNTFTCWTQNFNRGQFLSGTVSCPLTVARFAEQGNWTYSYLYCYDFANRQTFLSSAALAARAGSVIAFEQTGPSDTRPPNITAVRFSPSVVNTSLSSVAVNATIFVNDDVAGVSSCYIELISPLSNSFVGCSTPSSSIGQLVDGIASCTVTMPLFAQRGNWSLNQVYCSDHAGRTTYRYLSNFASSPLSQVRIQQIGVGDSFPPNVTRITLNPTVIDTSFSSQDINVSIFVHDDLSGLSYCYIYFLSPQGSTSLSCWTRTYSRFELVSGWTSCLLTVPQQSEPGNWTWNYMYCYDGTNRQRYLSNSDLNDVSGSYTAFVQVGAGDANAPVISSIRFNPSVVNTSDADANVEVLFAVTDDFSGVQSCYVRCVCACACVCVCVCVGWCVCFKRLTAARDVTVLCADAVSTLAFLTSAAFSCLPRHRLFPMVAVPITSRPASC